MKKQIILITTALLFSLLFYQNSFGLNLSLFSLLTIVITAVFNFSNFRKKKTILFALIYFTTSILFFINTSALSLIGNIVSFFIYLGTISNRNTSIYIQFINGIFSTIASQFFTYLNNAKKENRATTIEKIDYLFWIKIIGIPFLAITIFVVLYRSANPIFYETIKQIDFSSLNFSWLIFTVLGYYLFSNIINPASIEPITITDVSTSNQLSKNAVKTQTLIEIIQENQIGITLLSVLNLLILFFLITDGIYLAKITDITAVSLSKIVHEGIYALITSIVLAILIIVYFFRGNLNFYEGNKTLKTLTIFWIGSNILLIFTTCYKNYLYITHFGLTYKRIGVYVYLLLALVGLLITGYKVLKKYNLWYLLRKNVNIVFALLIMTSFVNWDVLITQYNTTKAAVVDISYLLDLENNSKTLKTYLENNTKFISPSQERLILTKHQNYTSELLQKKWQEITYENLSYTYENQ